jgi:hypothetical protein
MISSHKIKKNYCLSPAPSFFDGTGEFGPPLNPLLPKEGTRRRRGEVCRHFLSSECFLRPLLFKKKGQTRNLKVAAPVSSGQVSKIHDLHRYEEIVPRGSRKAELRCRPFPLSFRAGLGMIASRPNHGRDWKNTSAMTKP